MALAQSARIALRSLARAPAFSLAFVVTLGLGIGANTAIFSLVRGVLIRPLPHRGGERILHVKQLAVVAALPDATFSVPEVRDYEASARNVEGFAEFSALTFTMLGGEEPRRVRAGIVSGNYFDILGLRPVEGRLFDASVEGESADPVMVLTHDFWMSVLGGDREVIGRSFRMNGRSVVVIGVLEPVPHYPERTDVFVNMVTSPHHMSAAMTDDRLHRMTQVFTRLVPGETLASATAELDGISRRLAVEYPEAYVEVPGPRVAVTTLKDELTSRARATLVVLLGTATFVLLIACANVANLTVSRTVRRGRELAIRSALGAGRFGLRGQLLLENLLLASGGAGLGLFVTSLVWGPLVTYAARFTPRASEIELDTAVLSFAVLASLGAAVVSVLAPSLPASGTGAYARATAGAAPRRFQGALVAVQLAVCFVLLIGAGLLVRTLSNLHRVDPGFETENLLTLEIPVSRQGRSPAEILGFYEELQRRVSALPHVDSVALTSQIPLAGSPILFEIGVEGYQRDPGQSMPRADYRSVSPEYFETLGVRLLEGRAFASTDHRDAPNVVILNESMAHFYFAGGNPVGRRLRWSDEQTQFVGIDSGWRTIVGVAADTKDFGLDADVGHVVYQPFAQEPWAGNLLVRTKGAPQTATGRVVSIVRDLAPDQPVENVRTMEEIRSETVAPRRLNAALLGTFAALAVTIAGVGVFGLLGFSVSQRGKEFGIRASLGADRRSIVGQVLEEGMKLHGAGLALGAVASFGLARFLRGFLFGVEPIDPTTVLAVALFLTAVALVASWIPARRASRVEPVEVLRTE